jgi:PAS domain S-box-containing protein
MVDQQVNDASAQNLTTSAIPRSLSIFRLQPSLSALETWGFGFSGLLLWLGPAPAMHAALGSQAIWVWLPGVMVGMLLNFQVKQLGQHWSTVSGGTPNYTTRLLERYPKLAAYAAIGYFFGWAAVPIVNAIILTDLLKANLATLGISCPELLLKVGFTLLAFIVAFSGTRALGILHLFFILPALGFLIAFCLQGMGWLVLAPSSPGFLPTDWSSFRFTEWAKWFFIIVYAVYACETASSFVADSRRPTTTLRCLSATAWLIPVIYLGGSWVLMRLSTEVETGDNAFLNLLSAATPFWGDAAPTLVTFLIASGCLLSCATGLSNSPRVLYQMSLDGYLSPVFGIASRRGVLGPALIFTLFVSLTCLIWGDVSRVVMVTGTGYFVSIMATHLGLWLQRGKPAVKWAGWSLGFFLLECVVLVVGGLAWSWQDLLIGLLLPAVILAIDTAIRHMPFALLQPEWWIQQYRAQKSQEIQDFIAPQVTILLILVCGTATCIWALRSQLIAAPLDISTNLFVVLLLTVALVSIAVACWTSLPQITTIAEAKEQAEQLFVVALNAILVLDEEGIIRQVNPAAERLFALTKTQLLGKPLNELLVDLHGDPDEWKRRSEQRLCLESDRDRIVEMSISKSTRDDADIEYLVLLQDITKRKQAETALQYSEMKLREKADQLEKTLQELRTTQAQVIQSEKMSSLGQLVAGVAHEINNPVNFIHGNLSHATQYVKDLLELVEDYAAEYPEPSATIVAKADEIDLPFLSEDLPKVLISMRIGTDRIREIVKSLRNFSRIDEADVKEVDIHEGIDSTLMILQNRLKAQPNRPDIQIIKEYGSLPLVECYAGQLNQVFMNILTNAIDALEEEVDTRKGGEDCNSFKPQIQIRTELAESDRVAIQITDNGPGMAESVRQRLLDPFFTTKPIGKGTGLGMAISHQIITEKHRGTLQCQSKLGYGTSFVITIPLHQLRCNQPEAQASELTSA